MKKWAELFPIFLFGAPRPYLTDRLPAVSWLIISLVKLLPLILAYPLLLAVCVVESDKDMALSVLRKTESEGSGIMKRAILILAFIWLVAPQIAYAKADLSGFNRLDGVSVYSDKGEVRVVIRFARDRNQKPEPVFFEKSVQFEFENTYINPSKRDFRFDDSLAVSATAYQYSRDSVRLRLFLNEDPRSYKDKWGLKINGDLLIFTIEKKAPPAPVDKQSIEKPADPVVQAEPAAQPVAAPADQAGQTWGKAFSVTDQKVAGKSDDTNSPLLLESAPEKKGNGFLKYEEPVAPATPSLGKMFIKMIASLCIVVALVLTLAWVGRKYLGKINALPAGDVVNVLATGSIGAKQQVSVIDVAGEVLVIGVAGENMTLLASLDDKETINRLRRKVGGAIRPSKARLKNNSSRVASEGQVVTQLIRKAVGAFRIGRHKTSHKNDHALFDQADPDTFAGQFKAAESAGRQPRQDGKTEAVRESLSRDDLMKRVTSAIKARNGNLRIA